jgi:RimJ/RimL family protein N-acetyltransferase
MKKINLNNSSEVVLRKATVDDASNMIDFYNTVGGQTDFLSFGKNEFKRNFEEYRNYIATTASEVNSILLLATLNEEIIGIATITPIPRARLQHVGTLGIVIEENYCGQGLGREMIKFLIEFCKLNGITKKITLLTREDNLGAIKLYKRLGFEQEGLLRNDNYTNGVFYNTISMGLIF